MDYIIEGSIVQDGRKNEYEVLELLGSGGFGNVFKLKRKSDGEIFALKTLQVGFSAQEYIDSFRHESEAATTISNANVLKYVFFHDGSLFEQLPPYIIMEFADGGSLQQFLEEQKMKGYFSNSEIKSMFKQLISGMNAINEKIIHRDLKPANVLISQKTFKISDFGLSKISEDDTRTCTFKGSGTYSYMSPEAWRLEKNTVLMDIYSMGLIFFEIATLKHALTDEKTESVESWRTLHLYTAPKNLMQLNKDLSPLIVRLIQRMIAKNSTDRFKSWKEIEDFLEKDNLPQTENSETIRQILEKKSEADYKKNQEIARLESEEKERIEKKKLVEYMFHEKVVRPVEKFVDELNQKLLPQEKITLSEEDLFVRIEFSNSKSITIECTPVLEENLTSRVYMDGHGIPRKPPIEMPKLRHKSVIAWGIINSSSEKGYNLLLTEKEDDPYGEWIILTNTSSALYSGRRQQPEPFPFDYDQLESELPNITAMHIYDMKDEMLNLSKIYDLISETLV
ncbi:MAG: serine/threonine protein kinase [Candidatus Aenigmarchaeota archaeon]|nr:serine/threonine protein kinase [Candidatus Aenigmarchaeota archaeon]